MILESSDYMELDLLDKWQTYSNRLKIFYKYGTKAAITDFSILLGGYVSSNYYTSEGNALKNRTGWWWTKTPYLNPYHDDEYIITLDGDCDWCGVNLNKGGIRPALSYSSIKSIVLNTVIGANGIKEIEYGEYPQEIVDENYSHELERAYNNKNLRTTGKNYTTDSVKYQDAHISFKPRTHTEYEYNGQKYIRFVGDLNGDGEVMSDGRRIKNGEIYWVKVEPITWLVDEEQNIAITKKIIVSGIQFDNERKYNGDFKNKDMYKFMNTYLIKDIFDNISIKKEEDNNKEFVSIDNKIKILRRRIDDIRK